jgi:hypothetical protein
VDLVGQLVHSTELVAALNVLEGQAVQVRQEPVNPAPHFSHDGPLLVPSHTMAYGAHVSMPENPPPVMLLPATVVDELGHASHWVEEVASL